jgi:hypothetical protein
MVWPSDSSSEPGSLHTSRRVTVQPTARRGIVLAYRAMLSGQSSVGVAGLPPLTQSAGEERR